MPQQATSFNFAALEDPKDTASPPPSGGFNFSALSQPEPSPPPPANRSLVTRALDAALTPMVSAEKAAKVTGAPAPLPQRGIVGDLMAAVQGIPDIARNLVSGHAGATLGGFARGSAEGALANLSDPVSLAGFLTLGTSRAIARPLLQGVRGLADAERALVAARLRSAALPEINRLRGELQSLRNAVDAQQAILRFARGADVAGSGAVAARGVEHLATADTLPEAGAGALQLALGTLGVKTAPRVPEMPARGPLHAAELPAARGYAVTPSGQAVPAGQRVPVETVADPSFVRGGAWCVCPAGRQRGVAARASVRGGRCWRGARG